MAGDNINEAELGRSKTSASPKDHLLHLLNIGWNPKAPLILKYAQEHGLMRELEEAAKDGNKS